MDNRVTFRCPDCGGDHFGSSATDEGRLYHCHGHESYSKADPKWPGWPGCGWTGTTEEFQKHCTAESD